MFLSQCRPWVYLSAWVLWASWLQASSTLNFPRLSFEDNTITGVAIVNPSADTAEVTITSYGSNGELLSGTGITNPISVSISAEEQYSRLTAELFGEGLDPGTVSWFQATSSTNGLTGFFLFLNAPPFVIFDGADLPISALDIVFQQVRLEAGYSTELNLLNPGSASANLELELIRTTDSPVTAILSLAAKGATRLDVADFFGVSASSPAYVTVSSDVPIAGFELVHAPDGDLVGLNARSSEEQLTRLYFPQVAVLGDFETQVGVVNPSTQAVILTLSAFEPGGSLYGTEHLQNNPVTRSLAPGEILEEDLESLFGFAGQATLDGWLQVESSSEAITGYLTYRLPDLGAAATVTPNRQGQTRAIFSHIATVDGLFTGVAVLNSGQTAANLLILAITPTGDILGSFSTVLQPRERLSKLITELIPEAENQPGGLIFVHSDQPVHLTSLFGTSVLSVLSNIPPQVSPDSYRPDAQLQTLEVTPPLAVLQPDGSQTFQAEGATGSVSWLVNGMVGGEASTGTITPTGNYTAPPAVPDPRTVTISAQAGAQTSGASVDVLDKQNLLTSPSVVQSVVYLGSLEKLYTSELTLLGSLQAGPRPSDSAPHQAAEESEIFEVSVGGAKTSLRSFAGEEIAKMIDFGASNGQELLLLAAKTSGRVIRLDPVTGAMQEVATDLDAPNSLVIDPVSGDLLVAEQSRVSQIPRFQLETGLAARAPYPAPSFESFVELFETDGADGIAVDQCTGDIYFSQRQSGQIVRYRRIKELLETVLSERQDPTQLLGVHRRGVSCPHSFELLFIERARDQVSLFLPGRGLARFWVDAGGARDVAFLPRESPFVTRETILLAEDQVEGSAVFGVDVPELYDQETDNPSVIEDPEPEEIDLGVKKRASSNRVEAGTPLTYTLTVRNAGPATATEVRLIDALPPEVSLVGFDTSQGDCSEAGSENSLAVSLTCHLGTLEKGDTVTVSLEVEVSPLTVGRLVNFAAVEGSEEEFDFSDNTAEESTEVLSPLMILSGSDLPPGALDSPYTYVLRAIGGERPYSWSLVSGSLPDGLLLSPDGLLFGEPASEGDFVFTVEVRDEAGDTDEKPLTIGVLSVAEPLTILPLFLAVGTVDTSYFQALAAIGGNPPYQWEVISGSLPDGLMFNSDGLLSGEPTMEGDFQFTVRVVDEAGETDEATFELTILPGLDSLTIATSALPPGTADLPYLHALIAIGGSPPYTWSLVSGSLPDGLSLSSQGLLSGTPTNDGDFNFTVQVSDDEDQTDQKALTLTIDPLPQNLTITSTSPFPGGITGQAYSKPFSAAGGTSPYLPWALTSGTLPGGLTLGSDGTLSGTPTTTGFFNPTVEVTDDAGATVEKTFSVRTVPLLAISTGSTLAGGTVGVLYGANVFASGGTGVQSWSLVSGSLPPGLPPSFSSFVSISGTPTQSGVFNFTLEAADTTPDVPQTVTKAFEITINDPLTLSITTGSTLPQGTVGVNYGANMFATGGIGAYNWTQTGGSIPDGLSLSLTSFGSLTGFPTQAGTWMFTLDVSDSNPVPPAQQSDSRTFSVTIDP